MTHPRKPFWGTEIVQYSQAQAEARLTKLLLEFGKTRKEFEAMDRNERSRTLFGLGIDNLLYALSFSEPDGDTNSRVDRMKRREDLRCTYCPPNKKENTKTYKKHGVKPPKQKKPSRK